MKKIYLDSAKCDGCRICELNCSLKHFGLFAHDISNCHVKSVEDTCDFTPYICIQCEEKNCINACPVEALTIDVSTGAIIVDHDTCIRCGICTKECEYSGIRLITLEGKERIAVCDLCGGDPQCAHYCYLGAISYR